MIDDLAQTSRGSDDIAKTVRFLLKAERFKLRQLVVKRWVFGLQVRCLIDTDNAVAGGWILTADILCRRNFVKTLPRHADHYFSVIAVSRDQVCDYVCNFCAK